MSTLLPWIPSMLLLIPYSSRTWINAVATAYQALAERNKPDSWIVPEPCACAIILVPYGRGLTFNCSIARVVLQRAAKLGEIVIYDRSAVQCDCIRSIRHYQVHIISYSFGENRLGAQCAYWRARKGCDINCTHPCFTVPAQAWIVFAC